MPTMEKGEMKFSLLGRGEQDKNNGVGLEEISKISDI